MPKIVSVRVRSVAGVEPFGQSEIGHEWFAATVEQDVSRLEIAMQNPVLMRVLHSARHFGHKPDAFARFTAQRGPGFLQAAAGRVFHAEERQPVFALADFIDGKNIRMIETGRRFSFTSKTFQRLARIGVIGHHSLERDDPARMPLTRAINHAHSAASDFLQNLVIANPPVRVPHFVFGEDRFERFAGCLAITLESLPQRAAQAKPIAQPRSRAAMPALGRAFTHARDRIGEAVEIMLVNH